MRDVGMSTCSTGEQHPLEVEDHVNDYLTFWTFLSTVLVLSHCCFPVLLCLFSSFVWGRLFSGLFGLLAFSLHILAVLVYWYIIYIYIFNWLVSLMYTVLFITDLNVFFMYGMENKDWYLIFGGEASSPMYRRFIQIQITLLIPMGYSRN